MLPSATPDLVAAIAHFIDDPSGWRLETGGDAELLMGAAAAIVARFVGPAALLLMAFGVAGAALQNAPRVVLERIAPDFKRLSPMAGFMRLFGPRGWTEFAKSALKLAVVGSVVGLLVASQRLSLIDAMFVDVAALPPRLMSLTVGATTAITLAVLVIAGADFTWTRIHWRRDQRMSRHEVKEEIRQAEGDRMLKARLRSLGLDRSRRNMMKNVPKATMVDRQSHPLRRRHALHALGGRRAGRHRQGRRSACLEDQGGRLRARNSRDRGQGARPFALRRGRGRRGHSAGILSRGRRDRASHPIQTRRLAAQSTEAELTQYQLEKDLAEHEKTLADAIVDVATELRLSDPTEFILLVRGEQEANISDLVNSSSELFFKKGALRYGLSADCALGWGSTPSVSLDMEFRHDHVTAFFRLIIGGSRAAVEVVDVLFDEEAGPRGADRLREAIAAAKLS